MTRLPRTFCWVWGSRGPQPQILFEPRVGCEGIRIIGGFEVRLKPTDTRTLDQLARDYPAPQEAV